MVRHDHLVGQFAPPALWPGQCESNKHSGLENVEILYFVIISFPLAGGKARPPNPSDVLTDPVNSPPRLLDDRRILPRNPDFNKRKMPPYRDNSHPLRDMHAIYIYIYIYRSYVNLDELKKDKKEQKNSDSWRELSVLANLNRRFTKPRASHGKGDSAPHGGRKRGLARMALPLSTGCGLGTYVFAIKKGTGYFIQIIPRNTKGDRLLYWLFGGGCLVGGFWLEVACTGQWGQARRRPRCASVFVRASPHCPTPADL